MLTVEEITSFLNKDATDSLKRRAREGQRYYEGIHDIRNYRILIPDANGEYVEDKTHSNVKISHPFFTELVDQTVQYMLSNKEAIIKSDNPDLQAELDEYFDDDFKAELNDLLTGVVAKGFDYLYVYKNSEGRLTFQWADGLGIIEVRSKDTNDHCDYIIYHYVDRIDDDGEKIEKIQVWDKKQVWYYIREGAGAVELDKNRPLNPEPHVTYTKGENDENIYYEEFGFIPFFRLDYNRKRVSALAPIKALIDDYDIMSCGMSNNLQDLAEGIYVVKNYQGENIDELIESVKARKAVGVDSEGGLEIQTVNIPYEARQAKLALDEDNIYRFGMGFNSQKVGDGNITNVVIKSRYTLLDLKCNKLEIKLRQFLKGIVKIVIDEINSEKGTDYSIRNINFDFTRETLTNVLDNANIKQAEAQVKQTEVNTLLMVAERLDNETLMQNICDVLEIDYEEIKDKLPQPTDELENLINDEATEGDNPTPAQT